MAFRNLSEFQIFTGLEHENLLKAGGHTLGKAISPGDKRHSPVVREAGTHWHQRPGTMTHFPLTWSGVGFRGRRILQLRRPINRFLHEPFQQGCYGTGNTYKLQDQKYPREPFNALFSCTYMASTSISPAALPFSAWLMRISNCKEKKNALPLLLHHFHCGIPVQNAHCNSFKALKVSIQYLNVVKVIPFCQGYYVILKKCHSVLSICLFCKSRCVLKCFSSDGCLILERTAPIVPCHSSTPVAGTELWQPYCSNSRPLPSALVLGKAFVAGWTLSLFSWSYPTGILLFLNTICFFMLSTLLISCPLYTDITVCIFAWWLIGCQVHEKWMKCTYWALHDKILPFFCPWQGKKPCFSLSYFGWSPLYESVYTSSWNDKAW